MVAAVVVVVAFASVVVVARAVVVVVAGTVDALVAVVGAAAVVVVGSIAWAAWANPKVTAIVTATMATETLSDGE